MSTSSEIKKSSPPVALTFDDGPYGKVTEKILDILKEKVAFATFFITGEHISRYPSVLRRIFNDGHLIANHGFSHSPFLFLRTSKEILNNIKKGESAIYSELKMRPRFYRPPHGLILPVTKKKIQAAGYEVILWTIMTSVMSADYFACTKTEKIVHYILNRLQPGSIIVLHDGVANRFNYPRENVIQALPKIIDGIRAKGYEIVPLDQLIGEEAYF